MHADFGAAGGNFFYQRMHALAVLARGGKVGEGNSQGWVGNVKVIRRAHAEQVVVVLVGCYQIKALDQVGVAHGLQGAETAGQGAHQHARAGFF